MEKNYTNSGSHINKMKLLRPQNPIEKKILSNKEFLNTISIGRSRPFHREGTIKNHIIQILKYIEKNYRNTSYYTDLRIMALLHDTGKFAFLKEFLESYMPNVSDKEHKRLLTASAKFKLKYYYASNVSKELKKYTLTPMHAHASYQFAKKFLKDDRMLKLLKYHDLAADIRNLYVKENNYDFKLFKKVFSNIDLKTYLAFLKCDNCNRIDKETKWLKAELKNNNIQIPR